MHFYRFSADSLRCERFFSNFAYCTTSFFSIQAKYSDSRHQLLEECAFFCFCFFFSIHVSGKVIASI